MLFLWILTWFSYGLFMKNQINILNITGAAVSASLIVFLYFLPSVNLLSLIKSRSIAKTQKAQIQPKKDEKITQQTTEINTQKQETESIKQASVPETQESNVPQQIAEIRTQELKAPQEITEIETQKLECSALEDNPQQLPSKANGCPKNLDYYTKKPRPKQTPEECITCKNLIDCVCLTNN